MDEAYLLWESELSLFEACGVPFTAACHSLRRTSSTGHELSLSLSVVLVRLCDPFTCVQVLSCRGHSGRARAEVAYALISAENVSRSYRYREGELIPRASNFKTTSGLSRWDLLMLD